MYVILISIYFIILYIYTHIYMYLFIVIYFKINYENFATVVYQMNTKLKYKEFFKLCTKRKGENSNLKF
jgi:hypothetical protein